MCGVIVFIYIGISWRSTEKDRIAREREWRTETSSWKLWREPSWCARWLVCRSKAMYLGHEGRVVCMAKCISYFSSQGDALNQQELLIGFTKICLSQSEKVSRVDHFMASQA